MTDSDYKLLASQFSALVAGESDGLANASNFVALLYNALDDVNWLGIYFSFDARNVFARARIDFDEFILIDE